MKDSKSKANNTNHTQKNDKSTKKPHIEERPTPDPPVPNRAHTEMKK